eukprot:6350388-Alexandrium_andersonii.AAC.1
MGDELVDIDGGPERREARSEWCAARALSAGSGVRHALAATAPALCDQVTGRASGSMTQHVARMSSSRVAFRTLPR